MDPTETTWLVSRVARAERANPHLIALRAEVNVATRAEAALTYVPRSMQQRTLRAIYRLIESSERAANA